MILPPRDPSPGRASNIVAMLMMAIAYVIVHRRAIFAAIVSIPLLDLFAYGFAAFEPGYGRLAFIAAIYAIVIILWEDARRAHLRGKE